MPIAPEWIDAINIEPSRPLYYSSLAELDEDHTISSSLPERAHWQAAPLSDSDGKRPRLLVCHDYKGGYKDDPKAPSYTFNFWSLCDTFIYFAHHRVSPPPSAWITAAHQHGSKILGTLIFEPGGEADCLRLVVGPASEAISANDLKFCLSAHYAKLLAALTRQRGFDGWLLNFECPLAGGEDQARTVAAWIVLLKNELIRYVGAHAEVIWYDSVTVEGKLRWQNRLCGLNLPFFLAADSIFTNYTWRTDFPERSAVFFDSIPNDFTSSKSRNDIYIGIDVWGRGCHGGGGFNCYRALEHIDPDRLGLSLALFGPGWTWESKQDLPGWTWKNWWKDELKFWLGPQGVKAPTQEPRSEGDESCPHGPFKPIASFFQNRPTAVGSSFFTTFSPGIGWSWFVEGAQVMKSATGWTDVDKQCPLGDEAWPYPRFYYPSPGGQDVSSNSSTTLSFEDAWLGGSSLAISFDPSQGPSPGATVVPIQSTILSPRTDYAVRIIAKLVHPGVTGDFSIASHRQGSSAAGITILKTERTTLAHNWFALSGSLNSSFSNAPCSIGISFNSLIFGKYITSLTLLIGLLSVQPIDSPHADVAKSVLKWEPGPSSAALSGRLSWREDTLVKFTPLQIDAANPPAADNPIPRWTFGPVQERSRPQDPSWHLPWAYQLIYVEVPPPNEHGEATSEPVFIGTSSFDGNSDSISFKNIPITSLLGLPGPSNVIRFHLRGVSASGEVTPWNKSASIEIESNIV